MPLTAEKIAELRAAAELAMPGPWRPDGDFVRDHANSVVANCYSSFKSDSRVEGDASHVANCDPQTIIEMLDEIEAGRRASVPHALAEAIREFNAHRALSEKDEAE